MQNWRVSGFIYDGVRAIHFIQENLITAAHNHNLDTLKIERVDDRCFSDDLNDPMSAPLLWISKWVDYSDKYGLGYQLCNNTSGVLFNDMTRLQLAADGA